MIGDTVNVASRLEGAAEQGEVLLGPETRAQLGSDAVVEAAGPFELKGKAEPIHAWRLIALKPLPAPDSLPSVHAEDAEPPRP